MTTSNTSPHTRRAPCAALLVLAGALLAAPLALADLGQALGAGAAVIGSAASGGLLGLAGSVIGGVAKFFHARQQMEEKRLEYEQELKLQEMQLRARAEETEQEIALANTEGSWTALSESYQADAATASNVHMWVADVKALFRPALTLILVALTGWIVWLLLGDELPARIGAETASALVAYVVQSVVFSASAAVLWWFGDRSLAPPKLK